MYTCQWEYKIDCCSGKDDKAMLRVVYPISFVILKLVKIDMRHDSRSIPSQTKGMSNKVQDIHQPNRRDGK